MSSGEGIPIRELHTSVFGPAGSPAGAAIFLHGHGDYSSRYEEILQPFTKRGIVCLATDLPGHGKSPGRRGFVPGVAVVDEVVTANLERARELATDGLIGLLGHSAGALLALREVLRRPGQYDFAWFSSPLLRPEATRHPLSVRVLRHLARWFPRIDLSTGVTEDDCRQTRGNPPGADAAPSQFHNRISLQWGAELVDLAREVRTGYSAQPLRIPALFTQGGADPVCPPRFLHEFLAQADIPDLTVREFPDQLHEPFMDGARDELRAALGNWLDSVLGTEE